MGEGTRISGPQFFILRWIIRLKLRFPFIRKALLCVEFFASTQPVHMCLFALPRRTHNALYCQSAAFN